MTYRDYKRNAQKHLDACLSILDTYSGSVVPESVLRELHYLSGYIIEGICVYAIYKHYEWEEDRDIKEYDEDFTRETGLDYYKNGNRLDRGNGRVIRTGAQYYITSHGFNQYVELLDVPFQGTNIPFIDASSTAYDSIINLIHEWKPDLRYRFDASSRHTMGEIVQLINACEFIYNQVSQNI